MHQRIDRLQSTGLVICRARWRRISSGEPTGSPVVFAMTGKALPLNSVRSRSPAGFSALISTPPWEREILDDFEKMIEAIEDESLRNLDTTMELMRKHGKPVVLSIWTGNEVKDGRLYRKLWDSYLTPYPTPDKAAKALARLIEYSSYLGVAADN